ncbi:MAG: tyrosine-type recombinase/integrase [Gemmatimonadota bacterium]|nr:tyrosine-type recombinase/integrase [Gemmatimonadota bacterium]
MTEPHAPPPLHPEVHPEPNFDAIHRFSAWLERMGRAPATVDAYHTDTADLVRAYAPRPVEELAQRDLREYLIARAAHDAWALPTVRRHLQSIKAFYRYLIAEESLRAPGPAESLDEPVPEPRAPHVIPVDQIDELFGWLVRQAREDAAARMDLALYGLCYHGALLVSEAVNLTLDAVRGGPRVMHLDVVGRRGEASRVTLAGEPAAWMARWLAERPAPKRSHHRPFVFIHPRTLLHTSRQRAWDRLKRIARAAGLPAETSDAIGPHSLRHSHGAHLAARATKVADVRDALRQRSPRYAAVYFR